MTAFKRELKFYIENQQQRIATLEKECKVMMKFIATLERKVFELEFPREADGKVYGGDL